MNYKINPFPAVRTNGKKWRFAPNALKYHSKITKLRQLIKLWEFTEVEIMEALIQWNYRLEFIIEIPKSWSKKKKLAMKWQPHRQTPDWDNLFKSFTDTLFYKQEWYNDSSIYNVKCSKYWDTEWVINFYITS